MKIRSRFFSVSPTYLSTTVARLTVYRSSPSSPAITSADIVLPVPESPANSAVTPCPRPPPGRIRHSVSTRSRCRARAASSRSCADTAGGEHEVVPADLGLDAPGEPLEAGGVLRPGAPAEVRRPPSARRRAARRPPAPRTARATCVGPEDEVRRRPAPASTRAGRPSSSCAHSASRSAGSAPARRRAAGPRRPRAGPRCRRRPGAPGTGSGASARSASGGASASASTGPATMPAPRSSASRPATRDQTLGVGSDAASAGQVEPTTAVAGLGERRRGDAPARCAGRCRAGRPARPRRRAPRASVGRRAGRAYGTRLDAAPPPAPGRARRRRAGARPPGPGTRSARVRNGRSASSTSTSPWSSSGAPRREPGPGRAPTRRARRRAPGPGRPGPAPGHVVVQVAVEPLEPAVEVGQQGDQQELDVEAVRPAPGRAGAAASSRAGRLRRVGRPLDRSARVRRRPSRRGRRAGQQPVDRLVGEVEPAERVVGRRVVAPALLDQRPDPVLDQRRPAEQVLEAARRLTRDACRPARAGWSPGSVLGGGRSADVPPAASRSVPPSVTPRRQRCTGGPVSRR